MTELGEVVNNIMKKAFPSIVDVHFTATMEQLLDSVEEGKVQWKTVIRNFYPDLEEAVSKARKELEQVKIEDEITDVICEQCGRNMVIKYGPHGKFLHVRAFRNVRIPSRIWKRSAFPVLYAEKMWLLEEAKKEGFTMAVRIIRNANLCPGRNLLRRSVRYVIVICWKRVINWCVQISNAVM